MTLERRFVGHGQSRDLVRDATIAVTADKKSIENLEEKYIMHRHHRIHTHTPNIHAVRRRPVDTFEEDENAVRSFVRKADSVVSSFSRFMPNEPPWSIVEVATTTLCDFATTC